MKKIFRSIFVSLISITTFTACTNDEIAAGNTIVENKLKTITFTARQESDDETRAAFNENKIEWRTDDQISVFDGSSNHAFTLTNGQGTTIGTFTGTVQESSTYVALYPYQAEATRSAGNQVEAKLPTEQTATPGSFDPNAGLMIAETNNETTLPFRNAVAYIKVTIPCPARKIKFSSRGGEPLSGNVTLNYNGGNPTTLSSNGCSYVDLVPASGTTFAAGIYYLAVCPQTLSQGFILSYVDEGGVEHARDYTKSYTIVRNKIINMGELNESNTKSVVSLTDANIKTIKDAISNKKSTCKTIQFLVNQNEAGTISTSYSGTTLTISTSAPKIKFAERTSLEGMFINCSKLKEIKGLQYFDTSNVTSMRNTFNGCQVLSTITGLENFDTQNVTDMRGMFSTCNTLSSINVSSFNTSKVTTMEKMFSQCNKLTSIDLSNFDTNEVTTMAQMFFNCNILNQLKLSKNFNMDKVISKTDMMVSVGGNLPDGQKCQVINAPSATQTAMSSGTGWNSNKMEFATVTP